MEDGALWRHRQIDVRLVGFIFVAPDAILVSLDAASRHEDVLLVVPDKEFT